MNVDIDENVNVGNRSLGHFWTFQHLFVVISESSSFDFVPCAAAFTATLLLL